MSCPTCGQSIPVGRLHVDLRTGWVIADGWMAHVPPRQAELLSALLEKMPEAMPVSRLITRVYGVSEPRDADNMIRTNVKRLRASLRGSGFEIKGYYGYGYGLRFRGSPQVFVSAALPTPPRRTSTP